MKGPWTELYVHCVWSTWDRLPLITEALERPVYACIQEECHRLKAESVAIGGIKDHVHVLARFTPSVCIADLVKQMKGVSSHVASHGLDHENPFKWQARYGAFTVTKADVPRVRAYIMHQKEHHRRNSIDPWMELDSEYDL